MKRVVVCIGGASGAIYAHRLLTALSDVARDGAEGLAPGSLRVDWLASANARAVWSTELRAPLPVPSEHLHAWDLRDFSAPFASGSSAPDAVVVVPCSMAALSRFAYGGGSDLIARTCDVALKERRPLLLVVRETPLSLVHLRAMVAVTEAGATVLPASPSFYSGVQTLEDAVDTVVSRVLDHMGLRVQLHPRWGNEPR